MNQVNHDIAISVGADISHLRRGMNEGSNHVRRFGRDADQGSERFKRMSKNVIAAAAAITAAMLAMARQGGEYAKALTDQARLANATNQEFQALAFGATQFGISQEKLADILKDVNDRIGDFIATGGGPMRDFFDYIAPRVGVTAEQFQRLSGPEALQLYVSSLEKANLTQQEMTFYLEAVASDLTALQPLLKDGGNAVNDYAEQAQSLGLILSDETLAGAQDAQKAFAEMRATFDVAAVRIAAGIAPALEALSGFLIDVVNGATFLAQALASVIFPSSQLEIATDNLVQALGDEIRQSEILAGELRAGTAISKDAAQQKLSEAQARYQNVQAIIEERRALALASDEAVSTLNSLSRNGGLQRFGPGPTGLIDDELYSLGAIGRRLSQETEDLLSDLDRTLEIPKELTDQLERTRENVRNLERDIARAGAGSSVTLGTGIVRPITPSEREDIDNAEEGRAGGTSPAARFDQSDFDALVEGFATERELLIEGYQERLEIIEDFRERKKITEEQFNDLEARIHADHLAKIAELDARQRTARLNGLKGMFGDLSSLMRSESGKLFEIGKAASIAQATISGYEAAVDAWKKGMKIGGPGLAAAFTAASLAKTGALISSISSTPRSGSGGSAASGRAVPGGEFAPGNSGEETRQQVNINLEGSSFSRGDILSLIDAINDATADGAALVIR